MAIHDGDPLVFTKLLEASARVEPSESTFTSAVFLNNRHALESLIQHELQQETDNSLESPVTSDSQYLTSVNPDIRNKFFQTTLTCCIDTSNLPFLRILTSKTKVIPTASDIFLAARNNPSGAIARHLLTLYPGAAAAPLELAIRQKNISVLTTLIVNCGVIPSLSTLASAVETGDCNMVSILIKGFTLAMQVTEPKVLEDRGVVLGTAVCGGKEDVIRVLVLSGAFRVTSAHIYLAARRGLVSSVRLMVEVQKIMGGVGGGEQGALDLAVKEGSILAVTVLATVGVPVGPYALAAAIDSGRVELLIALASGNNPQHGEEVFEDTRSIVPAVVVALAIQQGPLLMLRTLLRAFSVRVNSVLLLMGVRKGDVAFLQVLLQHFEGTIGKDILDAAFVVGFEVAECLVEFVLEQRNANELQD
ncbi:hypothetical protein BCR33DRAFT_736368 [Rhizoclosmatium globosum]|uniref:Ankyrin n=1 Tax=Rhizoclosmatium globosum TaxID=329046 RepID=A0A1Y2CIH5_9FUNG|nr:hypothetical protein BCR33DRAFT_736368 [Rhizoclosmatium globosum]|eukprot:ORY46851.1 hypothetical protein BCR33DRAFT_736368 [Rhizoclosmatium globosum]